MLKNRLEVFFNIITFIGMISYMVFFFCKLDFRMDEIERTYAIIYMLLVSLVVALVLFFTKDETIEELHDMCV